MHRLFIPPLHIRMSHTNNKTRSSYSELRTRKQKVHTHSVSLSDSNSIDSTNCPDTTWIDYQTLLTTLKENGNALQL